VTETSTSSSRPVECYRFEITGYDPMLFTSDEQDVVAEGDTYEALDGLSRSELGVATLGDNSGLSVTVPATSTLVARCGLFLTPQEVVLRFRRYQRSDLDTPVMRFDAKMDSAGIKGGSCVLKFPDAFSSGLAANIPKNRIQTQCNWTLGDANCGVDLDQFVANVDSIAEVVQWTAVVPGQYIIQASWGEGVDAYDPLTWIGGVITGVNGDVTEHRTIFAATFIGPNRFLLRARIELTRPFDIPLTTSTFTIRPGCDNSFTRCAVLQNTLRFGGFPYVPTERENPFYIQLNKKRKP
jgi:hypothetical protein